MLEWYSVLINKIFVCSWIFFKWLWFLLVSKLSVILRAWFTSLICFAQPFFLGNVKANWVQVTQIYCNSLISETLECKLPPSGTQSYPSHPQACLPQGFQLLRTQSVFADWLRFCSIKLYAKITYQVLLKVSCNLYCKVFPILFCL